MKRDAGDAQAVASWKKSFVRSSTGEEDATSTTVAASAAGGGARHDGAATAYDVDGPREIGLRGHAPSPRRARSDWRARTPSPTAAFLDPGVPS